MLDGYLASSAFICFSWFKNPMLVLQIALSNIINIAGSINATTRKLITAPLASSTHSALIISMLEYSPTPTVAAKKLSALPNTDCKELFIAEGTFKAHMSHIYEKCGVANRRELVALLGAR